MCRATREKWQRHYRRPSGPYASRWRHRERIQSGGRAEDFRARGPRSFPPLREGRQAIPACPQSDCTVPSAGIGTIIQKGWGWNGPARSRQVEQREPGSLLTTITTRLCAEDNHGYAARMIWLSINAEKTTGPI